MVTAKKASVQINNKQRRARNWIAGWKKASNIWRNTLVLLRPWQWIVICLVLVSAGIACGLLLMWLRSTPANTASTIATPIDRPPLLDPAVDPNPVRLKFSTTLSQPSK